MWSHSNHTHVTFCIAPYKIQDHVANEVGHLVIQLHHYHHWFYSVELIWTKGGGGGEVAQLKYSLRCSHVVRTWKILFTKSVRMTEVHLFDSRTTKGGHLWWKSTSRSYAGMAVHLTATCDDMMIVMTHWLHCCYNCAGCACSSRQSVNTSNSFMIKNIMIVFLHYIASFTVSVSLLCVCVKTWESPLLCHYSASVWQHGHLLLSIGSSPCDINLQNTYIHMCECTGKQFLEIHCIYFSNKEIYCIFKTCCTVSVCFPQNAIDFIILSFFCLNNTFFINNAWKFKLQSGYLKVKFCVLYDMSDCLNQQSCLFLTGVDSWILLPARDVCECKSLPSRPTWRWNSSWWCWASTLGLLTGGVCSD